MQRHRLGFRRDIEAMRDERMMAPKRRLSKCLCNLTSAGGETFGVEKLKMGEGCAPFLRRHGSGLLALEREENDLEDAEGPDPGEPHYSPRAAFRSAVARW